MSPSSASDTAGFDQYATNYHDALDRGLSLTGEDSELLRSRQRRGDASTLG